MTVDEIIHKWAASKLDIAPGSILKVDFVSHDEVHWSSWTVEPAYHEAVVHLVSGWVRSIRLDLDGDAESLGDLVREILSEASTA